METFNISFRNPENSVFMESRSTFDYFQQWKHNIAIISGKAAELKAFYQGTAAKKAAFIVAYDRKQKELEGL